MWCGATHAVRTLLPILTHLLARVGRADALESEAESSSPKKRNPPKEPSTKTAADPPSSSRPGSANKVVCFYAREEDVLTVGALRPAPGV